jgi:rubredoxin
MTSQIGPLPKKPDCGGTPFNYYKSQVCFRWPDPLTTCDIPSNFESQLVCFLEYLFGAKVGMWTCGNSLGTRWEHIGNKEKHEIPPPQPQNKQKWHTWMHV